MTFTPPAPLIRSAAMLPPPARVIKLPGEVWLSAIDPKPGLDSTSNTRAASRISEPPFWDPFVRGIGYSSWLLAQRPSMGVMLNPSRGAPVGGKKYLSIFHGHDSSEHSRIELPADGKL
jgi:hypothetical protein